MYFVVVVVVAVLGVCAVAARVRAAAGDEPPSATLTPTPAVVQTASGALRGAVQPTHVVWRGVPYAQPPVGALRFAAPQPVASWSGVRNATLPQAACMQHCGLPDGLCPRAVSEDCLYLTVFAPRVRPATLMPVVIFLYGGGFLQGAANVPEYDAGFWVNHTGVLYVLPEYRVSAFGFAVTSGGATGNYGLLDQRAAMRWVQRNAAAFGGDASRVTLQGESAGAMSIGVHLVAPKSRGLFAAAVQESNPYGIPYRSASEATKWGDALAAKVGCAPSSLRCLRAVNASALLAAARHAWAIDFEDLMASILPWTPVVDGSELSAEPLQLVRDGSFARVPLFVGTNEDEGVAFINGALGANPTVSPVEYDALLLIFGTSYFDVKRLYPPHTSNCYNVTNRLVTDWVFACATHTVALAAASHGVSAYQYRYQHLLSFNPWRGRNVNCVNYTCHGSELPLVFHNAGNYTFSADEERLSLRLVRRWSNFVHTHDPNNATGNPLRGGDDELQWPAVDAKAPLGSVAELLFGTKQDTVVRGHNAKACKLFDGFYPG